MIFFLVFLREKETTRGEGKIKGVSNEPPRTVSDSTLKTWWDMFVLVRISGQYATLDTGYPGRPDITGNLVTAKYL